MLGLWVVGSFAGMVLVRALARLIMRHDDDAEARRQVQRAAAGLAEEAQAWLDQGSSGAA